MLDIMHKLEQKLGRWFYVLIALLVLTNIVVFYVRSHNDPCPVGAHATLARQICLDRIQQEKEEEATWPNQ